MLLVAIVTISRLGPAVNDDALGILSDAVLVSLFFG